MKKLVSCALLAAVFLSGAGAAAASVPYDTHNYLGDGTRIRTPHAYVPEAVYGPADFDSVPLTTPGDLFVDAGGRIYISDTGNNRILCLNSDFTLDRILDGALKDGVKQPFSQPDGLWVTDKGDIYVADTGNARVVGMDKNGNLLRVLLRPESDLLDKNAEFKPTAVAVDRFSRVFVVAFGVNLGIIAYDENGDFTGFVGSQRVSYNALDYLWKSFFTQAQKERMQDFIPTEYSNLHCDKQGFIYGVSSSLDAQDLALTIQNKQKDGTTAPVKKLNHKGMDILPRNGYYPPVGDVEIGTDATGKPLLSAIVDVALGEAETYALLDHQKSRIFTYSKNGDLLFAFGAQSDQTGNNTNPVAVDYMGSRMLVLDSAESSVTVYSRTQYGDLLIGAQRELLNYNFGGSAEQWEKILALNPNYAMAYDGIGSALLNTGEYRRAMEQFGRSENMEQYSEAFKGWRNQLVRKYLAVIIVALAVLIALLVKLFGFIRKCNKVRYRQAKHPLFYQLTYGFYVLFHPFDGFWDLKHEKRGSIKAAHIFYSLFFAVEVLRSVMTAQIVNTGYNQDTDVIRIFLKTVGVAMLFIVANWCLTSLMDGKADMKSIYTAVGYAVLPMIVLRALSIPLSYFIVAEEAMYITFLLGLSLVWTLLLVFLGVMVTQQYTLLKNTVTALLSIVGMGVIVFILLLFLTTVFKIGDFVKVLVSEITR